MNLLSFLGDVGRNVTNAWEDLTPWEEERERQRKGRPAPRPQPQGPQQPFNPVQAIQQGVNQVFGGVQPQQPQRPNPMQQRPASPFAAVSQVNQNSVANLNAVKVGDFTYRKNPDGTFTELKSGAKRTAEQIRKLQGGEQKFQKREQQIDRNPFEIDELIGDQVNAAKAAIDAGNEFVNSGEDGRNFAENAGDFLIGNTARLINTGKEGVVDPIAGLIQGRDPSDIKAEIDRDLYSDRGGMLDVGTFYANDKSTVMNPLEFGQKFAGAGLATAGEVVPVMRGGSLLAQKGLSTGQKVVRGATEGAAYGGGATAGMQMAYGQELDPTQIALGAGAGAILGGGIPALGYAAPAAKKGAKAVNETRPSVIARQDPRVVGYDDTIAQIQQRYDAEPNQLIRHQLNKAITAARQEQAATFHQVKRELSQGGYIAGPGAKGFKQAQKRGEVFEGVDGKPRFEVDDSGAKIKNPEAKTLGEALDHPKLYKEYPDLKDVPIEYDMRGDLGPASAAITELPNGKTGIMVNPYFADRPDKLKTYLLHELQHIIQKKEGFSRGASPETALAEFNKTFDKKYGQRLQKINIERENIRQDKKFKDVEDELNRVYQRLFNGDVNDPKLNARAKELEKVIEPQSKRLRKLAEEQKSIEGRRISDMDAYERAAGEAEARAVEKRMDMPMSERYVTPEASFYHGTNQQFMNFDPKMINSIEKDGDYIGKGFFFTRSKNQASRYAKQAVGKKGGTETVIGAELDMKNPLVINSEKDADALRESFGGLIEYFDIMKKDPSIIANELKRRGYDGLVDNTYDQVAVFSPKQIKVAKPQSTFYDSLDVPKEDLIIRNGEGKAMSIDPKSRKSQTQQTPKANQSKLPKNKVELGPRQPKVSPKQPLNQVVAPGRVASEVTGTPLDKQLPQAIPEISSKLPRKQSSTSKIQQKEPIVNEGKRALEGKPRTTYGLRDSFDKSDKVPTELKEALGAFGNERTVRSNKELWQSAQKRVNDDPADAMKYFTENNSDDAVATGYALINKYMKSGKVKEAGELSITMAERALESGRTTQAYALMKRLTPEGTIGYVEKKVARFQKSDPKLAKKLNWNDEVRKELYDMADKVNKMPEGRERNLAIGAMQERIDNIFPSSLADKAVTVWKAGLLTSLRTHERNILGNAMNSAAEQASFAPASIADRIMSLRTKKRTVVASTGEGMGAGAVEGGRLAKEQLQTGIDVTQSNLKYNINHITWGDNKVEQTLRKATEVVFRPLGAEDKIFREAARRNSLVNQAMAEAKTRKLRGRAYDDFVNERVENPSPKMRDIADQDAGVATFTHDNNLADIIKNAKSAVRRSSKPGAKAMSTFLDILMPFTQVPSGVASQLYHYSPAKLAKSMYDIGKVLITGDEALQREAARGFGRSAIGTSVIGAGAYLASQGLMTGEPKDDAEKAQWEAQGKKPNSIKIGDRWYGLQSIGPQLILALAGAQAVSDQENGDDPFTKMGANIGNNFTEQTFLKGINSFTEALKEPERNLDFYVQSQATSIIPNIVKDIARAVDPKERETGNVWDKFLQSIPGASQKLPEKRDSYGQTKKNSGVLELIDLFNSSKEKDIPEAKYVDALRDVTGLKDHIPSKAQRTLEINGESKKLTAQEYSNYQKYIGQKGKDFLTKAMNDTKFTSLGAEEQVKKIDNALSDINAAAKYELFGHRTKTGLSKDAAKVITKGGADVEASTISSNVDLSDNITPESKGLLEKYYSMDEQGRDKWFNTEKDAEYKYWKAKYENDKKLGKISKVQEVKWKYNLEKDRIGAKYSKDARDALSMSKQKISEYVSSTKDPDTKAREIYEYDKRLYEAGVSRYRKFKNGLTYAVKVGKADSKLSDTARSTANRYGVPPNIFGALIRQESGGNQGATSPVGARGLTQLMPATAKALGVDPDDPAQNLEGGAKYLAQQYKTFGSWELALAAYNAGPGAVQQYGGIPPFPETQNYVRTIMGSLGDGESVLASLSGKGGGIIYKTIGGDGKVTESTTLEGAQAAQGGSGRRSSGGRRGGGGGKRGNGVTEGKAMLSLTKSLLGIKAPRATGKAQSSGEKPIYKQAPIRKYTPTKSKSGGAPIRIRTRKERI